MGWSCSWAAVKGVTKSDLLAALDLVENGHDVWPGTSDPNGLYAYSERENGWIIVAGKEFDFSVRENVHELSRLGFTLGGYLEEHVANTSLVCAAQDGVELWYVYHDTEESMYRLDVSGDPPAELASIRARIFKRQDEEGDADYVFDIPMQLAKSVCGFCINEDDSLFKGLRPAKEKRKPVLSGVFSRLLTRLAGS